MIGKLAARVSGSLLLGLFLAPASLAGQHTGRPVKDPAAGGKIILPVPRNLGTAGGRGPVSREGLELVTQNDQGSWYCLTDKVRREANVSSVLVGFVPGDLPAERRRMFAEWAGADVVKADAYLTYAASLYTVEILCASGQYRFAAGVDVNGDGVIGAAEMGADWFAWRATAGGPWQAIRGRVCR